MASIKYVIGIDPDSEKHGAAIYKDGVLVSLESMNLIKIYQTVSMSPFTKNNTVIHIEDVNGVSAAFGARDNKFNIHVKLKMAQSIGKCKQSQIELERLFDWLEIKVVKHKISNMWKKDKAQFTKVTGWKKQSNEDTRSAAYFGYIGSS